MWRRSVIDHFEGIIFSRQQTLCNSTFQLLAGVRLSFSPLYVSKSLWHFLVALLRPRYFQRKKSLYRRIVRLFRSTVSPSVWQKALCAWLHRRAFVRPAKEYQIIGIWNHLIKRQMRAIENKNITDARYYWNFTVRWAHVESHVNIHSFVRKYLH